MQWVVRLAPRRGWTSSYLAGVLAGLVALGVLLAALLFVALLSRCVCTNSGRGILIMCGFLAFGVA